MKMTDEEKKNLKKRKLICGYKSHDTAFFDSVSYKRLRETMLDYFPNGYPEIFNFIDLPKSELLKCGRYVIDKHFSDFDLRVPYTNGDDMLSQLIAKFGHEPKKEQYNDIIDYINNHIDLVRVTDIPVYLEMAAPPNGHVRNSCFYIGIIDEEKYLKKLKQYVSEISLEGSCDEDTTCIYVHEMAHALIDRNKGSIENLLNTEAFSIFMERLAARDLDPSRELLDLKILLRLLHTKDNVLDKETLQFRKKSFNELLLDKTYIISTLHATALFDTYDRGSNKLRSEIDRSLGKVITGEDVLEDVFKRYEATGEKGSRIIQRQIKKYHNKYMNK